MIRRAEQTKYGILIGILFELLRERKVTAPKLARKFDVSTRTVYRYLDELSVAGVPVTVQRGRQGGIAIPGYYKLPVGFMTEEEYRATTEALQAMAGEMTDSRYNRALAKIAEQIKREKIDLTVSGNILVDGTAWGDVYSFSDTLNKLESAVDARLCAEIDYISRLGESSTRIIEPHLLVLKQSIWYIYAYCRTREEFRLFRLNRIARLVFTGEHFERRPFRKSEIPLHFTRENTRLISIRLQLTAQALPDVIEWLGIDSVNEAELTAEAIVPDEKGLIDKLMSFGDTVRLLEPASVQERLLDAVDRLSKLYRS